MIALNFHLLSVAQSPSTEASVQLFHQQLKAVEFGSPPDSQFDFSFEEFADRLSRLKQVYFEPDGSFCFAGNAVGGGAASDSADDATWSMCGMIYDAADRVQRIEFKGTITAPALKEFAFQTAIDDPSYYCYLLDKQRFVRWGELLAALSTLDSLQEQADS